MHALRTPSPCDQRIERASCYCTVLDGQNAYLDVDRASQSSKAIRYILWWKALNHLEAFDISSTLVGAAMCRTDYRHGKVDVQAIDRTEEADEDDLQDEDEDGFGFPYEEILTLHRRHRIIRRPFVLDCIPTACGILQNLQLVGIFPTARWLADPTMPPDVRELFGGTPFFPLGEYRVAHLDIQDATGSRKRVTLIVNAGVEGMQTGYWGGCFAREQPHSCWARFKTTGAFETTVVEEPNSKRKRKRAELKFVEFEGLEFCDEDFTGGFAPGKSDTQLERLLGTAVQFLLDLDWKILIPALLIEICDVAPRLERRRRAGIRATPKIRSKKFLL